MMKNVLIKLSGIALLATIAAMPNLVRAEMTSETSVARPDAESSAPKNKLWLRVGPGFSTFSYNDSKISSPQDPRTGIYLAAEGEYALNRTFSVVSGLDYIQKGLEIGNAKENVTISLNYIEVPILGRATFNWEKVGTIALSAGPYAAFAINRSMDGTIAGDNIDNSNTASAEGVFYSYDLGLRAGVDLAIPVTSKVSVVAGANYDFGLKDVLTNDTLLGGDSIHMRSLLLSAGFGITL